MVESLNVLAGFVLMYRNAFLIYSVCVELSPHLESWLESDEAVQLSRNTEPPEGWEVNHLLYRPPLFSYRDSSC